MRSVYILACISLVLASCKKTSENSGGENTLIKTRELGSGPQVTWKILEDAPGSKPSHRGYYATYPATNVAAIDQAEDSLAKQFIAEFRKPSPELLQNEDLLVSNSKITAFFVRQYGGAGKSFYSHHFVRYYDSKSGKRLKIQNLFNNPEAFQKFSKLAKTSALSTVTALIQGDNDIKAEEKQLRQNNYIAKINTGWTADLFDNTVFDSKNTTVIVPVGKIAEEDYGKIMVRIPTDSLSNLISDDYKDFILSKNSAKYLPPIPAQIAPESVPVAADTLGYHNSGPENVIALTFDDGPCNYTLQLLDILKKKNLKATFFVVGKMAEHYKPILKRIHAEGHQIANHSWNHADFRKLSLREVRKQLDDTNAQIYEATGQLPSVFRPPYGASNPMIKAVADMPIMLWNIDPLDWKIRNTAYTLQKMSKGGPEDIVLGHDIHITTVNAVPQLIENLERKNLKFVTVDELFRGFTLKCGRQYAQKHRPGYYKVQNNKVVPVPAKK